MKRVLCVLLCAALLLPAVSALAEKDANTLPQKLLLQFVKGGGVKGAAVIKTKGDKEWAQRLSALNDRNIQFTMVDGVRDNAFQYLLYLREGDEKVAQSEVFSDGKGTGWFRSDFLPDTVIAFPTEHDLLSSLAGLDFDNPTWILSALRMSLMSAASWQDSWEPRLAESFISIDSWMNALSGMPEVLDTEAGKRMLYRCEISVDELKKQMKALVPLVLGNEQLLMLLSKQVSREEEALYLNKGYQWYYDQCIDQLPLEGSIVLERQVTAMGETVSTLVSLPVTGVGALKEVNIEKKENVSKLSLIFADETLVIASEQLDESTMEGEVRYQAEGKPSVLAHYTMERGYEEGLDAKGRNTETTTWHLKAVPAAGEDETALDFAPVELTAKAHLYSKYGESAPTTLEFELAIDIDDCKVQASVAMRTADAADWKISEAPAQHAAIALEKLTKGERGELWQDWLENFVLGVSVLPKAPEKTPEPTAVPEPEPTAIPLVELTAAPAAEEAEPTEAPAA